jgi:enediyne biosynthesis protein E3
VRGIYAAQHIMAITRAIRRRLLGIPPDETSFERRGFDRTSPHVQRHLERAGASFVAGYHAALEEPCAEVLGRRLAACEPAWRGFAFEGAAMALALLDRLTFFGGRWRRLLEGPGEPFSYLMHVGAGWALARTAWLSKPTRCLERFDPLLRWLVIDGYGFHHGYFQWRTAIERQRIPRGLSGYARRAFDQGLGRSLWFVRGARPDAIAATIARFPASRRGDLFSGVGLACAYAGGLPSDTIVQLVSTAREMSAEAPEHGWLPSYLAQGAIFAAKARQRAGTPSEDTEAACVVLCGCGADAAAAIADEAAVDLRPQDDAPAYEVWRRRIAARYQPVPRAFPCRV